MCPSKGEDEGTEAPSEYAPQDCELPEKVPSTSLD